MQTVEETVLVAVVGHYGRWRSVLTSVKPVSIDLPSIDAVISTS